MDLVRRTRLMREVSSEARARGKQIAFVPTMGSLHDGHLSLVRRARELADVVVVSIFVNPTQFGPHEDFKSYPRDLSRDADLCIQEGVDYVFAPAAEDMFPQEHCSFVTVEGLSEVLEGESRPGHFRGVCTVLIKLFNIVRPHYALFGKKDAQQTVIVRRMVRDLDLDVEIVTCPSVRDDDGLALSSRNVRLSALERQGATALHRALERARVMIEEEGVTDARQVDLAIREEIACESRARVDYVALVHPETLQPLTELDGKALIALAAWMGECRLIDNVSVEPKGGRRAALVGEERG